MGKKRRKIVYLYSHTPYMFTFSFPHISFYKKMVTGIISSRFFSYLLSPVSLNFRRSACSDGPVIICRHDSPALYNFFCILPKMLKMVYIGLYGGFGLSSYYVFVGCFV
jgi:hypothetical protein